MSGKEQVDRLAKVPLVTQPGPLWEYSLAVGLQGRVIEAETGKRAGEFLAERICKPLRRLRTQLREWGQLHSRLPMHGTLAAGPPCTVQLLGIPRAIFQPLGWPHDVRFRSRSTSDPAR